MTLANSELITNLTAPLSNNTSIIVFSYVSILPSPIFTITFLNNSLFSIFLTSTDFSFFSFVLFSLNTIFLFFFTSLSLYSPIFITLLAKTSNLFKNCNITTFFFFSHLIVSCNITKFSTSKTLSYLYYSFSVFLSFYFLLFLLSSLLFHLSFFIFIFFNLLLFIINPFLFSSSIFFLSLLLSLQFLSSLATLSYH